ncbi:MAG: PEP-CTERM sorting domain-containing protein [Planctomycetes bacterium]|nr:PEP-CTERM sorting domain-containing protein [Planctomycetota bacterium]
MKHLNLTLAGMTLALAAVSAHADYTDPFALGGNSTYHQTNEGVRYKVDGIGEIFVSFDFTMSGEAHLPPIDFDGPSYGEDKGKSLLALASIDYKSGGDPFEGSMNCAYFDSFNEKLSGRKVQTFDTELTALNLEFKHSIGEVMLRESEKYESLGRYTISYKGKEQPSVQSYFDIFMDISVDGGKTWTAGEGSAHLELVPVPVPAPGALALLGLGGLMVTRRRRS